MALVRLAIIRRVRGILESQVEDRRAPQRLLFPKVGALAAEPGDMVTSASPAGWLRAQALQTLGGAGLGFLRRGVAPAVVAALPMAGLGEFGEFICESSCSQFVTLIG
jgi:hypothetical protein